MSADFSFVTYTVKLINLRCAQLVSTDFAFLGTVFANFEHRFCNLQVQNSRGSDIISAKVRSCHTQQITITIGKMEKLLSFKVAKTLNTAFTTFQLDNGNTIVCGFPDNKLLNLQRVQNSASQIFTHAKKFDLPILKECTSYLAPMGIVNSEAGSDLQNSNPYNLRSVSSL
jgi:hypothetical protein